MMVYNILTGEKTNIVYFLIELYRATTSEVVLPPIFFFNINLIKPLDLITYL